MARKEADLICCGITQALQSEYWAWTEDELKAVGSNDITAIAAIIKERLENGGCEIAEMYAVIHDKDTRTKWDESVSQYVVENKTNHIHCTVKFAKGATLAKIAAMVGLEPQFIEKAKKGKYGYDNMLSYLIHIKYSDKYPYDASEVLTVCGRPYTEIYSERKEDWLKGRAKVQSEKSKADIDWLETMILEGQVTFSQVMLTDEYFNIYSRNKRCCDDAFDTYGNRKAFKTIQALENGEFKLSVFFFKGESGAGKTRGAKKLITALIKASERNGEAWRVCSTASSNPMDDYHGEEILFMDDLRGVAMSASDWLKLLDPYNNSPASARYHNKVTACRVIIITSTKDPIEFFYYCKQMGGGNRSEALDQFMRRIESRVRVIKAENFADTEAVIANSEEIKPVSVYVPGTDGRETVALKYGFPNEYTMLLDDAIDDLIEKVMFCNRPKNERELLADDFAEREDIRRDACASNLEYAKQSIAV